MRKLSRRDGTSRYPATMPQLGLRLIDELERLVTERLRLELRQCDLHEQEQLPRSRGEALVEDLRVNARMRFEVYVELIPLLRRRVRNRRLVGDARVKAQAQLDKEMEQLGAKLQARVSALDAASPRKERSACSAR
jgi:hypothetical protein